ncbi:MAG: HAD hydrolase family protein, partial [Butyrivibrio sp.]|nr:HAD hydrolase family protein [Butyrivibrio sp.]
IIPKGSGKDEGIRRTCELLDIPHEATYAVGDSSNDLGMLRYAAHGICMGNGTAEAKEAAEYVTAALKDDGLYKAMEHYGLI